MVGPVLYARSCTFAGGGTIHSVSVQFCGAWTAPAVPNERTRVVPFILMTAYRVASAFGANAWKYTFVVGSYWNTWNFTVTALLAGLCDSSRAIFCLFAVETCSSKANGPVT